MILSLRKNDGKLVVVRQNHAGHVRYLGPTRSGETEHKSIWT